MAYVDNDPELTLSRENGEYFARWNGNSKHKDSWLDWYKGNIYTKNPHEALIDKMIAIATALDAQVQGDDGEIYGSSHEPPSYRRRSFRERFLSWLGTLRAAKPLPVRLPAFKVGDRMLDAWERGCTVVEIDPHAEHGLGKVVVRYDDNKIITYALVGAALHSPGKKKFNQT